MAENPHANEIIEKLAEITGGSEDRIGNLLGYDGWPPSLEQSGIEHDPDDPIGCALLRAFLCRRASLAWDRWHDAGEPIDANGFAIIPDAA